MAILTTALVSALAPAGIDAIKSLFGGIARRVGGLSVEDEIKLMTANNERLKGLAELDNPYGTPSQWVVDLRASFRYIAAGVCVLGGLGVAIWVPAISAAGLEVAASAFSFIFGDRVMIGLKK